MGFPTAGLIADANGDLFGTAGGGASSDGVVFEIAKTASGYASTPTTLVRFIGSDENGLDGAAPEGGLLADASGDLFGLTVNTSQTRVGQTVYEVTDSGYVVCRCPGTLILTDRGETAVEQLAIGHALLTAAGTVEPIRWIGQRSYQGAFIAGRHLMLPICIKPGAMAESFLDDHCRGLFHNAGDFDLHHPDAPPMAPLAARLEDGFALQRLVDRVAARAGVFVSPEAAGPLRGFCDLAGPAYVSRWAQDGEPGRARDAGSGLGRPALRMPAGQWLPGRSASCRPGLRLPRLPYRFAGRLSRPRLRPPVTDGALLPLSALAMLDEHRLAA